MGNASCFKKRKNSREDLDQPLIKRIELEYNQNFKEYFNMIKMKVSKFYQENQNNQFNISISLDKRDFNQQSIPKKLKLNTSEKFVYWKDYLLDYLNKQLHTTKEGWIPEVIQKIDEEIFLKENKWLSLFFWQEFELRTRPVQLIEDKKIINSNSPPTTEKYKYSSNISEKFHSSFVSITSNENEDESDKQNVYKDYKRKVKSYIKIFTQHIHDKEHPINIIACNFIEAFVVWLKRVVNEIKVLKAENKISSINDPYKKNQINNSDDNHTNIYENNDKNNNIFEKNEDNNLIHNQKDYDMRLSSQYSNSNDGNETNLGKKAYLIF